MKAFLFPGQGSQTLGMGADLAAQYPEAERIFEVGREILGTDILSVCRDGPKADLDSTRISQPAIFLHSMAVLQVLSKRWGIPGPLDGSFGGRDAWEAAARRGIRPEGFATAGLSLGEYSALVFSGSLAFEDAVRVVGLRGALMQEACEVSPGAMAAVIGFSADRVEAIVAEVQAEGEVVQVANYNSPTQTVISGEASAVDRAAERLRAAGARRVVRLNVAGAFHSRLMEPARRKLEPELRRVEIRAPRVPFYSNVLGGRVSDPEQIRDGLIRQVESPVRWSQIIATMFAQGIESAFELGPGRVLQGLVRATVPNAEVLPVGTCADIAGLPAGCGGEKAKVEA